MSKLPLIFLLTVLGCADPQVTTEDPTSITLLAQGDRDANLIRRANQRRPGIIPPEIVALANSVPAAVDFCPFLPLVNGSNPDPDVAATGVTGIFQSQDCAPAGVTVNFRAPEEFPDPLPNVNAVVVPGDSTAFAVVKTGGQLLSSNLILDEFIPGQTSEHGLPVPL